MKRTHCFLVSYEDDVPEPIHPDIIRDDLLAGAEGYTVECVDDVVAAARALLTDIDPPVDLRPGHAIDRWVECDEILALRAALERFPEKQDG